MFWKVGKPISLLIKLTVLYGLSLLLILSIVTGYIYYPLNEILHFSQNTPKSPAYGLVFSCIRKLFYVASCAAALSTFISYMITRNSLKHLLNFSSALSNITSQSLDTRLVKNNYPKELDQLTSTCNTMLESMHTDFNQLKRFSATIAHELRNPIHYLQNATEITLSKEQSISRYKNLLENHLVEYQNLSLLIDNILLLARSEYHISNLKCKKIDVEQMIISLLDYYHYAAEQKGIKIHTSIEGTIEADQTLLKRAVANLIDNAIKFTPKKGNIAITAKSQDNKYLISIKDDGIGISNDLITKIFSPYFSQQQDNHQGLGLGLATTLAIVKQHHGNIDIISEPDEGTEVIITF